MSVSRKFCCYVCGKDAPTNNMVHFVVPKFKKDIKMCFPCYGNCFVTINEINVAYGIDRKEIKKEQLENQQHEVETSTFRCELCGAVEFDGYTAQIITPKDKINMCRKCYKETIATIIHRNIMFNYDNSPMWNKVTLKDLIERSRLRGADKWDEYCDKLGISQEMD